MNTKDAVFILLAAAAVYLVERIAVALWRKNAFSGIRYAVSISHDERLCEETLTFSQTVTNTRPFAIPCLKIETTLPKGISFLLPAEDGGERQEQQTQSVFFLPAGASVTRTWFVTCKTRGHYQFGEALLLCDTPFGTVTFTHRVKESARLRVLPRPDERLSRLAQEDFFESPYASRSGFMPDLSLVRDLRDYTAGDPLHTVHWRASAKQGRLLVKEFDAHKNDTFNSLLNMQSRHMEPRGGLQISRPDYVEDCITVCASLLDSAAACHVPVSLIANAPCTVEGELFRSAEYCGQGDLLAAYRMLADIPLEMSMQAEKMLDLVLAEPHRYARGGHLLVVSSYLDRRMLNFGVAMQQQGIRTAFFITTTYQHEQDIPAGIAIYARYENKEIREVYRDETA